MDGVSVTSGVSIAPEKLLPKENGAVQLRKDNAPSQILQTVNLSEEEERAKLREKILPFLTSAEVNVGFTTYGKNRVAVVIYRKDTGEVIREIPPEEIQQLQLRLEEMLGIIFNRRI